MELNKKTLRSLFLGVAGCILLYFVLHETERISALLKSGIRIILPFIAGAAVAFILNVPMRAIEKWFKGVKNPGFRRALAIVVTLLIVVLVLFGVFYLLIPQIVATVESLVATLPDFFERVYAQAMEFLNAHPEAMEWLSENTDFENLDWSGLIQKAVTLITNSLTTIADKMLQLVISLSTGVFNAVVSLVFALYCLARKEILARQGRRLLYATVPEKVADEIIRILRMSNSTFSNFISGQCLEAVILGLMFAVCMTVFGMPYMPLVSVTIAVTALVPIVGAFVGCIVGAFFILIDSPILAFWFVIMFLILQQIEGNLIYPKVVGTSIGLPGMWVLVAVAVGGDLMGVGGMLLMIPLASVIYALLREFSDKRLAAKGIAPEKLQAQPPILKSEFKEKLKKTKEKPKKQPEEAPEVIEEVTEEITESLPEETVEEILEEEIEEIAEETTEETPAEVSEEATEEIPVEVSEEATEENEE